MRKTISKVEANQAQGAFNENIPLLEAALLKRPDDPDLLMLQIRNDLGLGKKSRADSIFLNRKILFFDEDYINFFIDRSYATGSYSSVVSACRSKKVKKKVEILGWDKYFLSIVNLGKIDSLEFFAEQYIQEKDDHYLGYYYKGFALEKRGIMERAKTEYNRSLYHIETIPEVKNYALACIYSGLGRLYFHYKLLDLALENCESALKADSALFDMVLMRSRILVLKDRYVDAQKSLSRALSMDPGNSICLKLIFYNSIKLNKPELALSYVQQLGKVVALNDSLLYERAKLLLSCKKYLDAYNDCKNLKRKGLKFPELETTMKDAKVDRVPPLLIIQKPGTDTIKYGTNEKRIMFEIFASDKTGLIRFTFNDSIINLNLDSAFVFKQTVVVNKYKSLSFSVVDAFDNITQINIPIKVDFSEPTVEVVFPQLLHGKSLVPENPEDMYVFLELSLSDNNRIETLLVNGVEKMITQKSQTKSYEKISIDKLDSIVVEVEDEMGNWAREAYYIDREKAR